MRWMDRRGGWTAPGKTSTQIIATFAIITGLLAIAGKAFFIGYYRIPQNGMYPTLPAGSILFTLKRAYSDTSDVKRGDIVVFVREQNGKHYNYIWRVVGMPGETVEASGESLTINSQPVRREPVGEIEGKTILREQIGDVAYQIAFDPSARERLPDAAFTVPPEHFFVMGDNRFKAVDSRYFGPIRFDSIIGKKL